MSDEKIPITYGGERPTESFVRVLSWEGEPLVDVDMSDGGLLSVQWPCRMVFMSIGGGISEC